MLKSATCVAALVAAVLIGLGDRPEARQLQRNPGVSAACGTFNVSLLTAFGSITLLTLPDEGWAWVDRTRRIRSATGVAGNMKMAQVDSFSNHDSHDIDFAITLDPGQEDLLSYNDQLGVEWESGIKTFEKSGDGQNPTYPRWAWPSDGDRVWVEGHWVFDCGHPENGLFRSEIHPPRAVASMRNQAAPLRGTGVTPVPVTLTDLHISGRGGYMVQQLNCGPSITLGPYGDTCGQPTAPADASYKTTPINDTDFTFAVCLPPRPPNAVFQSHWELGPINTVNVDPRVIEVAATGACATADGFDHTRMANVTVPLRGTQTPPEAVYGRRIYAGWVAAPDALPQRRRLTVLSTNLTEDHDLDPGDGELSFWWVNVNRAPAAWMRLSNFANGDMNHYDDETSFGDGEMSYTGASADFYLRPGQSFNVRSRGYEQDCYDNLDFYGGHYFSLPIYVLCKLQVTDQGDLEDFGGGDRISNADAEFSEQDFGNATMPSSDYSMRVHVEHLPLDLEDTSYLSLGLTCAPAGEVALVGQPLVCATRVDNAGPGLARTVTVRTRFDAGPPTATATAASWAVERTTFRTGPHACVASAGEARCQSVLVPVAAATPALASLTATPSAPGTLTVRADVTTASSDPDLGDNVATTTVAVFLPVALDVLPGDAANSVNLKARSVTIAVLSTAAFNAAAIDPSTVCFGDAEAPGERSCTESHASGHLEDVNRDQRLDLVMHFDTAGTGIDLGDTRACLIARTTPGEGVYGCDAVTVR